MSSVRVLHVADFSAPYPGAFIRQLRMLDEELQRRGEGRCVLAFPERAEGRPWLDALRRDGIEVHLLPEPRSRAQAHVADAIAGLVRTLGPDIVHTHFGTYDLSAAKALRGLRRGGIAPTQVWHYRTALEEPLSQRSPLRRLKDFLKYGIAARHVDRVIGVTEAMAVEVGARGVGDRAVAVVAGCDTDTFRAAPDTRSRVRADLNIGDGEVLVLHMGWAWHRKGGDLLAQAARLLADRGHGNLQFRSVGAPADEVERPVVTLPPTDAIHELHQASDIFVSASRSEGFGNGLVEALACERVAVAALATGQVEIFDGLPGCLPVAIDSAVVIADALEDLLARRAEWSALGAANRAHVVEHNSMRRWARELSALYLALAPLQGVATKEAAA